MLYRSLPLLLGMALLSACATQAPRTVAPDPEQAYAERAEALVAWPGWSLTGRLGVSQGDEGGSGRLDWTQARDEAELAFRGTLGQGAWRLRVAPEVARLELKDGTVREAPRVEDLVFDQTGWTAPVTALAWWVRGLAWPQGPEPKAREFNDDGTLARLVQDGWTVEWTRYVDGPEERRLPSRLQLSRADVSIRLAISRWSRTGTPGKGQGGAGSVDED
jgi:outer membrane lipoprotein LolB